jgi:hypothetical protein
MSGKSYFGPVQECGKKVHKQKLLLLCIVNEAYIFNKQHSNVNAGISRFSDVNPTNTFIAGACGADSVSVHHVSHVILNYKNIP